MHEYNPKIIIQKFKTKQKQLNLKQIDIANRSGLSEDEISRVLNDKRKMNLPTFIKIVNALEITDLTDFFKNRE